MVRYLAGLRGHVVVAPATWSLTETTPHSTFWAGTVSRTLLISQEEKYKLTYTSPWPTVMPKYRPSP